MATSALLLPSGYNRCLAQEPLLRSIEGELQRLMDVVSPSVVKVRVTDAIVKKRNTWEFWHDDRKRIVRRRHREGTGFVIDQAGHIVTRATVLDGENDVVVIFDDGQSIKARLVGTARPLGVSVLLPEPERDFQPVVIVDSHDLGPGTMVAVIGNTLGDFPTASSGMIRAIQGNGIMQLTANVGPGNSGSPVVNAAGEVVGMLAAQIRDKSGQDRRMPGGGKVEGSLAYPMSLLMEEIRPLLKAIPAARRGWFGLSVETVTRDGRELARVTQVSRGSPAEKMGLKRGDIITALGDSSYQSVSDLAGAFRSARPGQTLSLSFERQGTTFNRTLRTVVRSGRPEATGLAPSRKAWPGTSRRIPFVRPNTKNSVARGRNDARPQLERRVKNLEREVEGLKKKLRKDR